MSVLPRKEVTTCSVVSVRFGVLTDDEVRCRPIGARGARAREKREG
jgi:hypothetical protein